MRSEHVVERYGQNRPWIPSKAAEVHHRATSPLGCTPRCKQPCLRHTDTDQFHVAPEEPNRPLSPANKLQLAVLEDAIRTIAHAGSRIKANRTDFVYDVWWLENRRPSAPGFSLHDICTSLDLDYWRLRTELTKLAQKAQQQPQARKSLQATTKPRALRIKAA